MKMALARGPISEVAADVLITVLNKGKTLEGTGRQLDGALDGLISSSLSSEAFKGGLYETEWIYPAPGLAASRVLLVGAGAAAELDVRLLRQVAGAAARQARKKGAHSVCFAVDAMAGQSLARTLEVCADGVVSALAGSDLYKSKTDKNDLEQVSFWAGEGAETSELTPALERGQQIAGAVNFARYLGDEPANIMTPTRVAEEAERMASENGIECEIVDEAAIKAGSMGSLLSVSRGSEQPPRVVVLRYNGGRGSVLGLIGKGVTFDTGGISIKPALDMHYMKYDMCGAAAVIGTMQALAQTKSKANVIAVAGLVENMPGGSATRPGDVVRAANGKTIEIVNTDAEGRLVLADALDLAIKRGASRLVDVATLTGAIKVALAELTTGIMGTPQTWVTQVMAAGERAGERLWQMPLYPEYKDKLKSNIADTMNSGGRFGGASVAAAFLRQFVGETPWAHLDVAGTAWTEKEPAWQDKGATGVMIRTLVELAESASAEALAG